MPAAVPTPTHFFRFQLFHLGRAGDGGMDFLSRGGLMAGLRERQRRQRRGPRTGGKHRRTGGHAKTEFQKVTAFHTFSPPIA